MDPILVVFSSLHHSLDEGTSEQRCAGATPLREAPAWHGQAWFGHSTSRARTRRWPCSGLCL